MVRDQVQEIKEKIQTKDLISEYLSLKKAGKNYKALCPFHSEKTPSFMVSPDLQMWKCFGCGASGDIYDFVMKMEGVEFREALEILAERAHITLQEFKPTTQEKRNSRLFEINDLAARYFNYLLVKHDIGEAALDYLMKERGFSRDTIDTFSLGYAPRSWSSLGDYLLGKNYTLSEIINSGLAISKQSGREFYDRFRGRIIFSLQDHRGRFVGFSGRVFSDHEREGAPKYVNTPETPIFHKSQFLYGLYQSRSAIRKSGLALIVEGPTDLLSPYAAGYQNIVATQGTSLTARQVNLLKRYCDDVSICFDTDLAGAGATRRGINIAEKAGLNVSIVSFTGKYKDPDECVRQNLPVWEKAISQPVPVYDFYFQLAQKRYGVESPVGKKKLSQELLPVIAGIPDDIERMHYVQKLADILMVDESVVTESLSKHSSPRPEKNKEGSNTSFTDKEMNFENINYPKKEFYMLVLLLSGSLRHVKAITYRLGRADFSLPLLRNFFVSLKHYILKTEDFQISEFRGKIKNSSEFSEVLESLVFFSIPLSADEIEDELEVTLDNLKKERVQRQLKDLEHKIRLKEQDGLEDEVQELQKRFQKLLSKIL